MSDPIRSISQNNFLLAAQQEVSHDNTLSGNGTEASPLGLNETVLWEGERGWWYDTSQLSLSGSISDYDYFKVIYSDDWALSKVVSEYPSTNNKFDASLVGPEGDNITFKTSKFTVSGDKINIDSSRMFEINSAGNIPTKNFTTSFIKFYKIIGVNRKSST